MLSGASRVDVPTPTFPVEAFMSSASNQVEPLAETLKWKLSSPQRPICPRPEKPSSKMKDAVSPAAVDANAHLADVLHEACLDPVGDAAVDGHAVSLRVFDDGPPQDDVGSVLQRHHRRA